MKLSINEFTRNEVIRFADGEGSRGSRMGTPVGTETLFWRIAITGFIRMVFN